MKRGGWGIAGVVAAGLVAMWIFRERVPSQAPGPGPPPAAATAPAVRKIDGLTVVGGTRFDRGYPDAAGTAVEDLQAVAELWDAAVLLVKDYDRFPLADNRDFTAFLQGENPHRVAWIPPGHPAVGARGELLDRWQTAVFFHKESARRLTLRSAGPDRKMWSEDDVVWPE